MPEVTVCVLTYNRPKFLLEAVRSILAQTWENLRIVVLDNASTVDYSMARRALSDARVQYVRHDRSLGSWGNIRDACERYADSPYLMLFHDDDVMHPELIERQMAIMQNIPTLAWVSCRFLPFSGTTPDFSRDPANEVQHFSTSGQLALAIISGLQLSFGAVLYRGSALRGLSLEKMEAQFSIISDRPMLFHAMASASSAVLTGRLLLYRVHPAQDSRTGPLRASHLIALAVEFRRVMIPSMTLGHALRFGLWCAFNLPDSYFRLPAVERPGLFSFLRLCARSGVLNWWLLPWFPARRGLGAVRRTLRRLTSATVKVLSPVII